MVRRCVQKATGLEFASKIINTKKLSARGELDNGLSPMLHDELIEKIESFSSKEWFNFHKSIQKEFRVDSPNFVARTHDFQVDRVMMFLCQ